MTILDDSEAPILKEGDIIVSHCRKHKCSTEHVWGKWKQHGRRLWCIICWPSMDPKEEKTIAVECDNCNTDNFILESAQSFACFKCGTEWEFEDE
ncbi:hypothetical protein AC477_00040 [miscellaneous Crenarchaeota group-1 archaeon SG8-32-1]|uniref:Uncharacterized protein n=1 Tax=miscellaneous Crenarchaeota group-1 archaeon SG8-32-1 TaxID=1685124 RepID=A0A0M0C1V0_9ARCH|nr:MAG: hypothetical protein AC477_00040 [miscellaneous Crenarchaeota group-1 archaeon SG8-32-1]